MRLVISVFTLLLLAGLTVNALDVPASTGYVSDYAGMLSASEAQRLDQKLRQYDQQTTNQVVILIVKSLEGEAIESFGIRVAEKWKPGQKGKDNGVIITIAEQEHKTRIDVGYGLEGDLTDLESALILDRIIKPKFRTGKYYDGINEAVDTIIKAISGELKVADYAESVNRREKGKDSLSYFFILIFAIFIIISIFSRFRRGIGGPGIFLGGFGGGSRGGGGFSGGFSGGGGGFGGGGASGRW